MYRRLAAIVTLLILCSTVPWAQGYTFSVKTGSGDVKGNKATIGDFNDIASSFKIIKKPKDDASMLRQTPTKAPTSSALPQNAQNEILERHNFWREQVGADLKPLQWDSELADSALNYAKKLSDKPKLVHSTTEERRGAGENLARGYSNWTDAIDGWASERSNFINGAWVYCPNCLCPTCRCPGEVQVSRTGRLCDVGHYSQIVWRATERVGCGTYNNNYVCRYSPAGNMAPNRAY